MKKVLLLVSALLIVFSGVAAVSAYEGHLVNVKAHVENALGVSDYHVNFGTVFPQETLETDIYVALSESFMSQKRYSTVKYTVHWEPKMIAEADNKTTCDPDGDGYYTPIYPYIVMEVGGTPVIDWIDEGGGLMTANYTFKLTWDSECDNINLELDPPVFLPFWNELTDPLTPSGKIAKGDYCLVTENLSCGDGWFLADVPHLDLGSDLKIQVIDIVVHTPAGLSQ